MGYLIDIDSQIGYFGISKYDVKRKLKSAKKEPIKVRLNSLGGNLDHGLDIKAQFEEHGDVHAHLVGFNASSSTVISLGAKTVSMCSSGFYLIHKVSNFVGFWGSMNADQIADAIKELEANLGNNKTIDETLAIAYAKKTGKTADEMLDLMEKEIWLSAAEALEYGFIDEIVDSGAKSTQKTMSLTAEVKNKMGAYNLPISNLVEYLPTAPTNNTDPADLIPSNNATEVSDTLVTRIVAGITSFFQPKENKQSNIKIMERTDLTYLNEILGVDKFSFSEGKTTLNDEQATAINSKLQNKEAEIAAFVAEKKEMETRLNELESENTVLKGKPGAETEDVDTTDEGSPSNFVERAKKMVEEVKK